MQTKLLANLLNQIIEINRIGKYYSAFRYGIDTDSKENIAVDIYKDDKNLFHSIAKTNHELKKIILTIGSISNKDSEYRIHYHDEYVQIDEILPNESLAASKAFKIKQLYNVDVTISEVMIESM